MSRLVHIKASDKVVYVPAVGHEQPVLLMVVLQQETGMPVPVAGPEVDKMQVLLTAASVYHSLMQQMQQSILAQQGFVLPPGAEKKAMPKKKVNGGDDDPLNG
jgi:hypothetical protein